ncbi:MAG: hypothetical protein BAA02_06185 [Paenibacillaceae bacterium ZCTH02-B3]|nr:MAG: hypothetical protein BAA02_06185 [Paenibacillaceae bacterium ZCTH02-B3]
MKVDDQVEPYFRHFVVTGNDRNLPLYLNTVGYHHHQEPISREDGFPCYHWLHTVQGCGVFAVNGRTVKLPPNQGILLRPHVPHSYRAETPVWSVWFLTFDGTLAASITAAFELQHMRPIGWEPDAPLAGVHREFADKSLSSFDLAGLGGTLEVFTFLVRLRQFGRLNGRPSLSSRHERLAPVYREIEESYADPELGLDRLAASLSVSPQHLNELFRKNWGLSPYQYLLRFRIQKAKEMLQSEPHRPVGDIARAVGFREASHFIRTFRRFSGVTPAQFRKQFVQ